MPSELVGWTLLETSLQERLVASWERTHSRKEGMRQTNLTEWQSLTHQREDAN